MNRDIKLVSDWFSGARLRAGERLPPERALAETLGLSRAALRKGLSALEDGGSLLRQVGRGTFVLAEGGSPIAEDRTSLGGTVDASPRQALVARLALEPSLARMAAREGSRRLFERIEEAEAEVTAATDRSSYDAADEAFHRAVAEASGNAVLLRLFDEAMASWRAAAVGLLLRLDLEPGLRHAALQDHVAIRSAILSRDVPEAEWTMRRHLTNETIALVGELV